MKKNYNKKPFFSGLSFWGSEFLPKDIVPTWGNVRGWAFKNDLILEPELQLITSERIEELRKHFVYGDRLSIIIHLYKDSSRKLKYFEYPYLPIKTLIKRGKEVEIVYWRMIPALWNANGKIKKYGEARFGFWYPNITSEEFQSISNSKLIIKKFEEFFYQLPDIYKKKISKDGILDAEVDGDLKVKFFKTGRLYDVRFTLI